MFEFGFDLSGRGVLEGIRRGAGEDWNLPGESNIPLVRKVIERAESRIRIVTTDIQEELFGQPEIAELIERKLRSSVHLDVMAPHLEKAISDPKLSRLRYWFRDRVGLYSLGSRVPRLQFMTVDGKHTLNRAPDSTGSQVDIMIRYDDSKWCETWDRRFNVVMGTLPRL